MATIYMAQPNATLTLFDERCTPRWRCVLGRLCRTWLPQLLTLDTLGRAWRIRSRRFAGWQTVAIRQIVGSESRAMDFDATFRPCARSLGERWCSVADAWQAGTPLPPVELIRVGERYFVRDGHHRISVAAAYGAREIEALVTVWDVEGPLPWDRPARRLGWAFRANARRVSPKNRR